MNRTKRSLVMAFSVGLPTNSVRMWYMLCTLGSYKLNQAKCFAQLLYYSLRTADVSSRSSPLRDVSRGGTSATHRQKFHTDDAKSVRNPVRSANWSTEKFHCFSYCLRMTDKRQKAAKVKCKRDESLTKHPIFVEYSLL